MQTAYSRIWTRVTVSISHDNNRYILNAFSSSWRYQVLSMSQIVFFKIVKCLPV